MIVKKRNVVMGIALGIIVIFAGVVWYSNWLNATDYWGFAPDGDYRVFVDTDYNVDYSTHTVFFPLCEHSGGDLHGSWSFTDDVTFHPYLEGCGYYGVRLEGNMIIIAWREYLEIND